MADKFEQRPTMPQGAYLVALVLTLICLGLGVSFLVIGEAGAHWLPFGFAAFFGFLTVCALLDSRSGYVRTHSDRIEVKSLGQVQELKLEDIASAKRDPEYGTVTLIHKNDASKNIFLGSEQLSGPKLRAIVDAVPDYEEIQERREEKELLADSSLGATISERKDRLGQARRLAKPLAVSAWVIAIWALFWPKPYLLAVLLCALMPLAGLLLAVAKPAAFSARDSRQEGPSANVMAMFVLPSLALGLRAMLDTAFQEGWKAVAFAIALGVIPWGLTAWRVRARERRSFLVAAVFYWIAWGGGLAIFADTVLDTSLPELRVGRVVDVYEGSRSPSLKVRLLDSPSDVVRLPVSRKDALKWAKGDRICISQSQGWLGLRPYHQTDC